jgi:hypothetical protein
VVDEQELEGRALGLQGLRLRVWTTMPSVITVLQAIWSFGIFSTSTMQVRQLPFIVRSGC